MPRYPKLDINFPQSKEADLYKIMQSNAKAPWLVQTTHPQKNQKKAEDRCYFHRDSVGNEPACTICIHKKPNLWQVINIVPDENGKIPLHHYKNIMSAFLAEIADPAAIAVEGMASVDTSERRLEDYFSPQAVQLLKTFCETSNQSDCGSHPNDQEKWNDFLIQVYRDNQELIHCDVFGDCIKTAEWWREDDIPRLVNEYDNAMILLQQYESGS